MNMILPIKKESITIVLPSYCIFTRVRQYLGPIQFIIFHIHLIEVLLNMYSMLNDSYYNFIFFEKKN